MLGGCASKEVEGILACEEMCGGDSCWLVGWVAALGLRSKVLVGKELATSRVTCCDCWIESEGAGLVGKGRLDGMSKEN